jgi:hypothetical protein
MGELLKECTEIMKEYNIPDVLNTKYHNHLDTMRLSFKVSDTSNIFCDNVILWSIGNDFRNIIFAKCRAYFSQSFRIRLLRSDTLKNNDIATQNTPYFSYKISLSEAPIKDIIKFLKNTICDEIILHDIDITQDVKYITTREDVLKHILNNGIEGKDIVNDRKKVGDNCISFFNHDHSRKIKVYNKFVQMLESCDVMTTLGSRIHNMYVDPSRSMSQSLERLKDVGMTRIEVKFYSREVFSKASYINSFINIRNDLSGCRFYRTTFGEQWKALVDNIYSKSTIAVYLEDKKFFAYCHWWNSLTGKIQGGFQKKVNNENVLQLVSNYSFNGNTTKLIKVNNGTIIVEEYKRSQEAITLIPGPRGGLYPRVRSSTSPDDIGLVEYRGIKLGWVDTPISKGSLPLAPIYNVSITENLAEIIDLRVSKYRAGYSILKEDSKYKVISKGQLPFRGKIYTVIEVLDKNLEIIKVRCGKSLQDVIETMTVKTYFRTGKVIIKRGGQRDILIK